MDSIHDLVAEASDAGYQAGSSIYFSQTEAHSLEQSTLALGMSAKYMANLPVFVSNIVWGRIMTLTMTSTQDVAAMKAALSASYSGISGSVGAEHLQVLQSSTIKLVTIGGDATNPSPR